MRVSFMTFACPECSFDEVLELARRHDYDGIEFRCDSDHRHGVMIDSPRAQRREWRRRLADAGVQAACLATSLQFISAAAIEEAPARIELAVDIGAPGLRVFCGPLADGTTILDAIRIVAANLDQVADEAAAAGVKLWLETHDSMSLGVHAGAAVERLSHPAVAINWDNMHPYRNGEPLDATWDAIAPYVEHTHFHDAVARPGPAIIRPFGDGDLPLDEMYARLMEANYEGYFSGEWFGDQMGPTPDDALRNYKEGLLRLEANWQAQNA